MFFILCFLSVAYGVRPLANRRFKDGLDPVVFASADSSPPTPRAPEYKPNLVYQYSLDEIDGDYAVSRAPSPSRGRVKKPKLEAVDAGSFLENQEGVLAYDFTGKAIGIVNPGVMRAGVIVHGFDGKPIGILSSDASKVLLENEAKGVIVVDANGIIIGVVNPDSAPIRLSNPWGPPPRTVDDSRPSPDSPPQSLGAALARATAPTSFVAVDDRLVRASFLEAKGCPTKPPTQGKICQLSQNIECQYNQFCCPNDPFDCMNTTRAKCTNGRWSILVAGAPMCAACPASPPRAESSCSLPNGNVCEYNRYCCPNNPSQCLNTNLFHCINGVWKLAIADPACLFDVCPDSEPQPGTPCSLSTPIDCRYNYYCCPNNPSECLYLHHIVCIDGLWQSSPILDDPCLSTTCPASEPQPGTSCLLSTGTDCQYNYYCCPNNPSECLNLHHLVCTNGVWQLGIADPICADKKPYLKPQTTSYYPGGVVRG